VSQLLEYLFHSLMMSQVSVDYAQQVERHMRISRFKVSYSCGTQSGVKRCREGSRNSESKNPGSQKHRHQHYDTYFFVFEIDPHQTYS